MPFVGGRGQSSRGYFGRPTPPAAPTANLTSDGEQTVSWGWSSNGNGNDNILLWEYSYSTDNGTTWGTGTEVPAGTTSISRTIQSGGTYDTNRYRLRVRGYNSAGWGDYSTQDNRSTAYVYTEFTAYDTTCDSTCTECDATCSETAVTRSDTQSVACGTCGCQGQQRDYYHTRTRTRSRTRSRSRTEWRWQKGSTYSGSQGNVTDWGAWSYSGWTYSDWGAYGAEFGPSGWFNVGGCNETTSANNYQDLPEYFVDGVPVYVGWFTGGPENQAYRTYSFLFGWYVSDSAGNATMTCNSGSCLVASNGIKHCNTCGNNKFIPYGSSCNCFSCC